MAYDIGPKIGIDGEAEFRNQLKQVNTSIKTLGTEMQAVTAAFIGQEKSSAALTAKNEVLSKTAKELETRLEMQKKMVDAATEAYGEADERTLKWKQTVYNTTTELNKVNAQIQENERALLQNGNTVEETADAHENSMGRIGEAAKTGLGMATDALKAMATAMAAAIGAATAAVGKFAKDSIEAGAAFDGAMSQVAAVSGATGKNFDDLRAKAMEMGAKTKFSATEAADAMNYMAMAGWKTSDMLNGIEGIMSLAAASGEDLATTSDIVTDALTAFGLSASDSGHFANVMAVAASNANTNVSMMGQTFKYVAPVAGALGYSVDDTAMAIGLMANSGIKATQAGTALRSIMTRLSTDAGASSKSLGALGTLTQELGVQFYDAEGSARELSDVINDSRAAWSGLSEEQQISYAKTIAGTEAMSGWLALMNAAPADVEKLTGAIQDSEGAAAAMAATMQNNLTGDITLFQSALESAQIMVSDKLTPSLREFVQFGTEAVATLSEAFQEGGLAGAMDALGTIITDGLSMVVESAPQMLDAGIQLVEALGAGFIENLPVIVQAGQEIMITLLTAVADNLPGMIEAAGAIVFTLVSGLSDPETLNTLMGSAGQILSTLGLGITEGLPVLLPMAVSIITTLIRDLSENLPRIVDTAADIVIVLATALTEPDMLGSIVSSALKLVVSLAQGLIQAIPKLLEAVPKIIKNLFEFLSGPDFVPQILASAAELIASLVVGLFAAAPELVSTGVQLVAAIIGGMKDGALKIQEVGADIVRGLWVGIKNMGAWLDEQISGFVGGMIDGVKNLLGIHSPSTVFSGIGENMAAGLGKGWDNEIDGIRRDIENSMDFSGVSPSVNMPGITMGRERPNYQEMLAGVVNGMQTATAGTNFPQSATIILQTGDGMTLARWILPDLRAAMRDDPEPV